MPGSRLAVVTVTFNSSKVLDEFLLSASRQSLQDFKLYVIDNASADDTLERLRLAAGTDARIAVVANAENVGFAAGSNQGIRLALEAERTHVLLLNNDTTFPAELFATLMHAAVTNAQPVVVPKIYYHGDPNRLWFAGGRLVPSRGYAGQHLGDGELDNGQFDVEQSVEYSSGCCMLVSASVFRTVGLLDPRYFVYHEDVDFCLRLARAGIPIWYAPRAYLYHKVSSLTGGLSSPFSARMGARNRAYYLKKNFGPLACAYFSSTYFAYLIMRWVMGRDSWDRFRLKAKSFAEGLRM
jgi:GT2 family glycosyltransferase